MIVNSSYSRGDSGGMQRYMKSDDHKKTKVKNAQGREITRKERAEFTAKCKENDMWRHVSFSPDPRANMGDGEMNRGVRKTMSELKEDRPSLDYHYAVHNTGRGSRDYEHEHAHVIMTGDREDVEMWEEDLEELRETATENFNEPMKLEVYRKEQEMTKTLDKSFDMGETMAVSNEVETQE